MAKSLSPLHSAYNPVNHPPLVDRRNPEMDRIARQGDVLQVRSECGVYVSLSDANKCSPERNALADTLVSHSPFCWGHHPPFSASLPSMIIRY